MADRPTLVAQLRALSRHEHSDVSIGADAADVIEGLAQALRYVDSGLRTGHIKDQSLIDRNGDGPEAKIVALSEIVRAALRLAKGE